jgi:hypothetical protein
MKSEDTKIKENEKKCTLSTCLYLVLVAIIVAVSFYQGSLYVMMVFGGMAGASAGIVKQGLDDKNMDMHQVALAGMTPTKWLFFMGRVFFGTLTGATIAIIFVKNLSGFNNAQLFAISGLSAISSDGLTRVANAVDKLVK